MLGRIKMIYPDGTHTWATYDEDEQGDYFIIGKTRYTPEDIVMTKATAVVNDAVLLRRIGEHGINVRPTPRQVTISIAVAPDLKEELKAAAEEEGTTISDITTKLIKAWLLSRK